MNIESLGRRANGKWVLWDVNLEINPGEITGIFGRSESGKSTLARIIAGMDEPTRGSITLDCEVEKVSSFVSLALSAPAFAPELTIYENLDMFASLWGIPGRRRVKEIAFLMQLLNLTDSRSIRAGRLSSGVLRRLELARALIADAPALVIDSLLDTLDHDVFEKLWEHLLRLKREESRAIIILTSRGKVAEMCGRMVVLHRGRIVFLGPPDDFRRLAGEDMVVLGDITSPQVKSRIKEKFAVVIQEEEGFLSFRVTNGERMVGDLLSEFGTDLSCVYLKRPTLEDALDVIGSGEASVVTGAGK
ncbi:MAG: ABC transporter ATP-binding protein [Armatimonadetes bacterium]|nr:ABC transporter ATP-binding protein [Armatimonadota bacterium]